MIVGYDDLRSKGSETGGLKTGRGAFGIELGFSAPQMFAVR